MDMQVMKDDEIRLFRNQMRITLNRIFLDRLIKTPADYFAIWQELRHILEDELGQLVNKDVHQELKDIQGD